MRKFLIPGVITALLLTGCSQTDSKDPATNTANGAGFEITNCGFTMQLDGSVQRALPMRQASTETLLDMGLEDQMVGTAGTRTSVAEHNQEAFKKLPEISEHEPKLEQIVDVEADLVLSEKESRYVPDRAGTREELRDSKIYSFVSNTDCSPGENAFTSLERDYEQLGQLFGKPEAGKSIIDNQRKALDDAKKRLEKVTKGNTPISVASIYSIYNGELYTDGKRSPLQGFTDIVGIKNAFESVDQGRPKVEWEAFADSNPDYIILGDLSERGQPGDSPEDKIAMLKDNPATKNMDAVRDNKFIVVPGVSLDPSSRSIQFVDIVSKHIAENS